MPGHYAHGFEALTDLLFCYHVTREYDLADPDEHGIPWDDPRVRACGIRKPRSSRSGTPPDGGGGPARGGLAGGVPRGGRARGRSSTSPSRCARLRAGLVLHAAAWTDVDAAEADEAGAGRVNVQGTRNVAALGAPVVHYSSDYVFDGSKREPYVESDEPAPLGAYGRTKLLGEREVRRAGSSGARGSSAGPGTTSFGRCSPRRRTGRGAGRGRPARLPYLRRAPGDGNGELTGLPGGLWHVAAEGEATWADFAAIFEEAGLACRVVPISTEEFGRPAPRPAYSVLRSEREVPRGFRTGARDFARPGPALSRRPLPGDYDQ